jgi:hypothetical protein
MADGLAVVRRRLAVRRGWIAAVAPFAGSLSGRDVQASFVTVEGVGEEARLCASGCELHAGQALAA